MRVHDYLARLAYRAFVSMAHGENIHAIKHHAKAFVAVDGGSCVDAAAGTVETRQHIGLKGNGLPALFSVPEAHLYKGGVRTVDILQIQLACHIIQRLIVSVFAASVFMVAGDDAQDTLGQAFQCAHEVSFLIPWPWELAISIRKHV